MFINFLWVDAKRMGPNSFQWSSVMGQGAMGTNWSIRSSIWTWGKTLLWGWQSTGTGCPDGLWILLHWRYSNPAWMWSCATCFRWSCFGGGIGLEDPQQPLPNPTILWFCITRTIKLTSQVSCNCWKIPASVLHFRATHNVNWSDSPEI